MVVDGSLSIYGAGNVKVAYTDLRDVGKFVARIIADPRTLNRYVFVWGEERTQQEVFDIARAASGKDIQPIHVSLTSRSQYALVPSILTLFHRNRKPMSRPSLHRGDLPLRLYGSISTVSPFAGTTPSRTRRNRSTGRRLMRGSCILTFQLEHWSTLRKKSMQSSRNVLKDVSDLVASLS